MAALPTVIPVALTGAVNEFMNAYLGSEVNPDQLDAVVSVVTAMARSYTRGNGWVGATVLPDISAVIMSASARLLANPTGTSAETMGAMSITYGQPFAWSLAERIVLDRYRVRAV